MLSVGDTLKTARKEQGLTLSQIEKETKIREKFLRQIELNQWNFASRVYIAGIVKNYADYLNLDSKKMLAFFRRDYEKKDDVRFKRRITSDYLVPTTKRWIRLGIAAIFILFFLYFGYQLFLYLKPPVVTILQPKIKIFNQDTSSIEIVGKTEKDAVVTIFGERVFQDKNGIFDYNFPLKNGRNVLSITVVGANGKQTIFQTFFYKKS